MIKLNKTPPTNGSLVIVPDYYSWQVADEHLGGTYAIIDTYLDNGKIWYHVRNLSHHVAEKVSMPASMYAVLTGEHVEPQCGVSYNFSDYMPEGSDPNFVIRGAENEFAENFFCYVGWRTGEFIFSPNYDYYVMVGRKFCFPAFPPEWADEWEGDLADE